MNAAERQEIRKQLEACYREDGYSFNAALAVWTSVYGKDLLAALDAAEERIAELTEALRDAINEYECAAKYKGDHLTRKHCDAAEVARLRAVLERQVAE